MSAVPGEVMSHTAMCAFEGANLQRGMNFRLNAGVSVVLMSTRRGAPYADRVEDGGRTLIYEGHDTPARRDSPDPKAVDQPLVTPGGRLTQNGLFYEAANRPGERELVRVYEKIRSGIWVYNGMFKLMSAWIDSASGRDIFRFRLEIVDEPQAPGDLAVGAELEHTRMIPTPVKLAVWERDRGRCVSCGATDNLHFDHVIPYSLGGTSLVSDNIQLLCARHNLQKHAQIQ